MMVAKIGLKKGSKMLDLGKQRNKMAKELLVLERQPIKWVTTPVRHNQEKPSDFDLYLKSLVRSIKTGSIKTSDESP
tara:strand:- start:217 stop:447 length:231 start_codon:yes stop_codon:yes gene_type:complete